MNLDKSNNIYNTFQSSSAAEHMENVYPAKKRSYDKINNKEESEEEKDDGALHVYT